MPDVNLTVSPPVAPLVTVTPASVFISLGNVVGAVGSGTSQFSVQGTGTPGNPYQLVGDAAAPGNWMFWGTNGSGTKGWLAQGVTTQFSLIGNGITSPLQLSGDTATPGNNVFYGTNASAVLGYYTPPVANASTAGYVPTPPNNTTTFLRGDATFAIPPSATATTSGYVPIPPNNTTTFLRGDATFSQPDISTMTCPAWSSFTCTLTPGSGTITTQSSSMAFLQIGKLVHVNGTVQVTNIGTAAGTMAFSLPAAAKRIFAVFVRETGVAGAFYSATALAAGATTVDVRNGSNASPTWANNFTLNVSFIYEAQ